MRTGLSCGAGFPAGLGALCRLPLFRSIASSVGADQRVRPWSMPPGLPHRPLRGARSLACHTGNSRGASRQACHAGGHAGRATQSRAVREFPRHPARTAARSTSTPRPCGAGFLACGRLSSRPGRPLPTAPLPSNRLFCRGGPACPPAWSMPPGLPCRRSRRQSHTIPNGTGLPTTSGPHDCALHLNPRPPLWGRLSSRPGRPLPTAPLPSNRLFCKGGPACPPAWSMPPGLPHRPLRGARSLACHTGSLVPVVGF